MLFYILIFHNLRIYSTTKYVFICDISLIKYLYDSTFKCSLGIYHEENSVARCFETRACSLHSTSHLSKCDKVLQISRTNVLRISRLKATNKTSTTFRLSTSRTLKMRTWQSSSFFVSRHFNLLHTLSFFLLKLSFIDIFAALERDSIFFYYHTMRPLIFLVVCKKIACIGC